MQTKQVVTSFLEFGGKILILRRSERVSTYKGKWSAVTGFVESGENPAERAAKEIEEETGLKKSEYSLAREGESFSFIDHELKIKWVVHPFLFAAKTDRITIEREHREFRWIRPEEISKYPTVPRLDESLRMVLRK